MQVGDLNLCCELPTMLVKTWWDIIVWIPALASAIYGVFQIKRKNEIARAEMLRCLLGEYNSKIIIESIQAIDDGKIVYTKGGNFVVSPEYEKSVSLAEHALLFFSNLCYLRETNLLTKKEFSFFEWRIRKVMSDQSVRNYVKSISDNDKNVAMRRLLSYCD